MTIPNPSGGEEQPSVPPLPESNFPLAGQPQLDFEDRESLGVVDPSTGMSLIGMKTAPKTIGESSEADAPFSERIQHHTDIAHMGSQWLHQQIRPPSREHLGTNAEHFFEDHYHSPDFNPLWGDHDEDDKDSHPEFSNVLGRFFLDGVSQEHHQKEIAHQQHHGDSALYSPSMYGKERVSNHEIYEMNFNNWQASPAGLEALKEEILLGREGNDLDESLRRRHMSDAKDTWKNFDEVDDETGRSVGLGELDYYFGLEWLSPKDKIAFYEHLMEHGSMKKNNASVFLPDLGMEAPMGRFVANFHQRYAPVHAHHTRDVDATGEPGLGRINTPPQDKINPAEMYKDLKGTELFQRLKDFYEGITGEKLKHLAKVKDGRLVPSDDAEIRPNDLFAMANMGRAGQKLMRYDDPYYSLNRGDPRTIALLDSLQGDEEQGIRGVDEMVKEFVTIQRDLTKHRGNGRRLRNAIQFFTQPFLATEGKNAHPESYMGGKQESLSYHFSTPFLGRGGLGKTHATRLKTMHDAHRVLPEGGREKDATSLLTAGTRSGFLPIQIDQITERPELMTLAASVENILAPFGPPESEMDAVKRYRKTEKGLYEPKFIAEINPEANLTAKLGPHNIHRTSVGHKSGSKVNSTRHDTTTSPKYYNELMESKYVDDLDEMGNIMDNAVAEAYEHVNTIGSRNAFGSSSKETGIMQRDEDAAKHHHQLSAMIGAIHPPGNPSFQTKVQHPHDIHDDIEMAADRDELGMLQGITEDSYDGDLKQLNELRQKVGRIRSELVEPLKHVPQARTIEEFVNVVLPHQKLVADLQQKLAIAQGKVDAHLKNVSPRMREYEAVEGNYNSLLEQQAMGIDVPQDEIEEAHEALEQAEQKHYTPIKEGRHQTYLKGKATTFQNKVQSHVDAIDNVAKQVLAEAEQQGFDLFSMAPPDTVMAWAMKTANDILATQGHDFHGQEALSAGETKQKVHARHDAIQDQVKAFMDTDDAHEIGPNDNVDKTTARVFGDEASPYQRRMIQKIVTQASNQGSPVRIATVRDLIASLPMGVSDTLVDDFHALLDYPHNREGNFELGTVRAHPDRKRRGANSLKVNPTMVAASAVSRMLKTLSDRGLNIEVPNQKKKGQLDAHYTGKNVSHRLAGNSLIDEKKMHKLTNLLHGIVVDDGSVEYDPFHEATTTKFELTSKPIGRASHPDTETSIMSIYNSDGLRSHKGHMHDVPFRMDIRDGRMVFRRRTPKKMRLLTPMMGSVTKVLPQQYHGHFGAHNDDRAVQRQPNATRANQAQTTLSDNLLDISTKMDGPTLLASLTNPDYIRKDMPEGLPSLQPMHRIFDVDDLEHLRGFTGDWVVSDYPEGERMFVTKKDDDVESKGSLTDEEKKAFKQVSDKDFLVDVIRRESGLYIFEVIEFDGKEVHDIPIQDRIKLLRGALQSVEGVEAPSASDTKLTDDVGLADAIKNIESDRILLRDAKSTYMKGEARHPKWVMYQKGNDVTLMVLERRGQSPYTYRLGTGPIIHGEDLGDRAVKIEDDIYMDIGASFNAPEKYEAGDFVKVNVTSVTEGEASEYQKVYTVHAPRIEGEAEGEPLVSTESLAMLAKADMTQSPLNIYRSDRHIRVSFEAGDVLYKATTRGQYWTVHTPVADNDYLIRLSESQRPFWSPVAGVMLKGDFDIAEREDKAEVHESKNDGKPLIPPKKIEGTGTWDKEKKKVMKKGAELLERLLAKSGVGQVGMSASGPKGLGIDYGTPIQSPTGPTNPDDAKTMPDYDVRDIERDRKDEEEESKDVGEVDSKLELTEDKAVYHI